MPAVQDSAVLTRISRSVARRTSPSAARTQAAFRVVSFISFMLEPPSKTKRPSQTRRETSELARVDEKERYTRNMT